jgi:hypothetical protein
LANVAIGTACGNTMFPARRKHLSAVRQFLEVKPFDDDGKTLLRQTFGEAALTKEDVIDIINIGIEVLGTISV